MSDRITCGAISCGATTLFQDAVKYTGKERRKHKRVPKTLGIKVQPLDPSQSELNKPFFAITRDISKGGLAYISSIDANFEMVSIALEDDPSRMVVCRVCACNLIHANDVERVYLTSVEFLYERHV